MTYVISDIHGNSRRFNSVMEQIDLQPEDMLYVLGDVIDRYPDGIRILRQLMGMPNVKMILGNHEYMMLNVLDRREDTVDSSSHALRLWYHGHAPRPFPQHRLQRTRRQRRGSART